MATTLEQLATENRLLENFQRQTAPIAEPVLPTVAPKPMIDPEIADVPYASATPEQQPPQTNITYLPAEPEQQQPEVPAGAVPYTPTLAEIREYNTKNGIIDPILDLTAEEIAELEEKSPKEFNLEQEFIRLQPQWNQELFDKASKAYNLLERKGGKINLGLGELPGMAKHAAVGAVSWAQKAAKAWGVPFAIAMEKVDELMGLPPSPAAIAQRQKIMREAGEAAAGTEASMTGLAFMGAKAMGKLFGKKPELKTEQEQKDSFKAALIPHLAHEQISKGAGLFSFRPDVREELAQAGVAIRPEEVEKALAGDPIGFLAFGKGIEGVAGLLGLAKTGARLATRIPGVPTAIGVAQKVASAAKEIPGVTPSINAAKATIEAAKPANVAGKAIQAAGATAEAGARLVERVAPIGVPIASAITGGGAIEALGHVAGAVGGLGVGSLAARPIVQLAGLARRAGAAVKAAGKEVAGTEAVTGNITQGLKDVFQSLPSVGGSVAHGAALDLGLAALTNTTPGDQQGLQLGTILGAVQGLRKSGAWVVSGHRIAPRKWGSAGPVQSSGQLPAFDAMHRDAYSNATPAQREHINAVRSFLRGAGADTDVFMADPTHVRTAADGRSVNTDVERVLTESGYDAKTAEEHAKMDGMYVAEMPTPSGGTRRAIVVTKTDAAPHEAKHAFQDVLGEQANQVIDKVIREAYADEWESLGQHYANLLVGGRSANWRNDILNAGGGANSPGNAAALLKLQIEAANRISASTGAQARPADVAAMVPERLEAGEWSRILTPEEAGAVADKYIAREVAAENFDAVFKNLGASLKEKTGVLPWLARLVASTTEILGGDSLAGRRTDLGFPVKAEVAEAIKTQAREFVPEVTPRAEPGAATPPRAPITPQPTPTAPPGTPEQEAAITRDVAADAPTTPTGPEPQSQSQSEILGTFAEAKARNSGVKITRRSAPGTPAGAIEVSRGNRRIQIETARSIPDSEKPLWEKNFVPVKTVVLNDGTLQEQGWSPEVLAANAEKLANFLSDTDVSRSPFEIDPTTKSFTAQGWRDLFEKFQTYAGNQAAGLTGRGTRINIGEAARFGFYEPAGNRRAVGTLTDAEMNFINYLMGFPLPAQGKAAVTRGGKAQYGVQKISEATEPGRALPLVEPRTFESKQAKQLGFEGEQVLEVNPFRAEVEALARTSSIAAPSPIEVWQNLNVRDIVRSEVAPELPAARPVGVTTRAGFKPPAEPTRQEFLDAAKERARLFREKADQLKLKVPEKDIPESHEERQWALAEADAKWAEGIVQGMENRLKKSPELANLFVGQFKPSNNPRAIKEAAVRDEKGDVYTAPMHAMATMKALEARGADLANLESFDPLAKMDNWTDGFVTNEGEFLTREQAHQRAMELKQVSAKSETAQTRTSLESQLFAAERKFRPGTETEGTEEHPFDTYERGFYAAVDQKDLPLAQEFLRRAAELSEFQRTLERKGDVSQFGNKKIEQDFEARQKRLDEMLSELPGAKDTGVNEFVEKNLAGRVFDAGGKLTEVPPQHSMEGTGFESHEALVKHYLDWGGKTSKAPVDWYPTFYAADRSEGKWKVRQLELAAKIADSPDVIKTLDEVVKAAKENPSDFPVKGENSEYLRRALLNEIESFEYIKNSRRIESGYFGKRAPFSQVRRPKANPIPEAKFKPGDKEEPRVGLEFKKFFSDVTKGTFGKSQVPFTPITDLKGDEAVIESKTRHSGNFDDHIAKSIPTFYEDQIRKVKAITEVYGDSGARVLDIAASEGSFGKAISELSDGRIQTVSLDPNPDMRAFFESKSSVPGATYAEESFQHGFEDSGKQYPAHKPAEPYDVVTEAMGFQFMNPDRASQIAEVKNLLKPDGVFLTEQKVRNPDWKANEAKKDAEYKAKYFSGDELKQKDTRVGFAQAKDEAKSVGMVDNMANQADLERILTDNFKHVVQYWDSGNFKGYAAGNDAAKVDALVSAMGDNTSKFSTVETPREVGEAQFKPKAKSKKQDDQLKFKINRGSSGFEDSKVWILPNGKVEQLGGQWHHDWLDQNKEIQKRYGLDIPPFEGGDTEGVREQALKKGFTRVSLTNGDLRIEAREKDWKNIRPIVEDLIERNIDNVDRFRVTLFDDGIARITKTHTDKLFDADTNKEKMGRVYDAFSGEAQTGARGPQFKPSFEADEMASELEKIKSGESFGQTFTPTGKVWSQTEPSDVVTLASVNVPKQDLSVGLVKTSLEPYSEVLEKPGIVAGVFELDPKTASIDVNAVVPQEHRENTKAFATANQQHSFWDANKGEVVETGGSGQTVLKSPTDIADAADKLVRGEPVQFKPSKKEAAGEQQLFGGETDLGRPLTKEGKPKTRATTEFFESAVPRIVQKDKPSMFELQDYLSKRAAKLGKLDEDTAENNSKVAETLADEAQFALSKDNNALGWYDRKVKAAIRHVTELHPELAQDPEKLMVYKAMLAITSNGTDIRSNFARADELYEGWKKTGRIETDSGYGGKTAGAINDGLSRLQRMIDEKGLAETKAFLEGNYTVKELENLGFHIPGEGKSTRVNGSVILGPKIGSFFANLNGDFSPVTMDRWFMRTFRRIVGNLTDPSVAGLPKQIDRVLEALAGKRLPEEREQLKQLKRDVEKGTFDPADMEGNQKKYGDLYDWIKKSYRAFVASRFADRSDLNMGVKNLHVNLFEANEAPNSGSERERIRTVMAEAKNILKKRGIEIVNADLQALLWYYEKDLYQRFGVGTKRGISADYETAAKELLESKRGATTEGELEVKPRQRTLEF